MMKVAVVCKSDLRGGAAVVSYRLMKALRAEGVDARMVVCEKLSDDPYVIPAGSFWDIKRNFIVERLRVAAANGRSRETLWQIDPATDGLPLARHPWIKEADAVLLNWVNQGMLSTKGLENLLATGKPVIWTMHDKWNMTALCHHTGDCDGFLRHCENCPLLPPGKKSENFSRDAWLRKHRAYRHDNLYFVGVSSWVVEEARRSSLMAGVPLTVIPNAFPVEDWTPLKARDGRDIITFGAARIDDPVKGLPYLEAAMKEFCARYPEKASTSELVLFGAVKDPTSLDRLKALPMAVTHTGSLAPEAVRDLLERSKVIVSTSSFETLPTTLIEGQAAGALPVSFDRGGQRDIIDHDRNGFLIPYATDPQQSAPLFADNIAKALDRWTPDLAAALHADVLSRFAAPTIATRYLDQITRALAATTPNP